MGKYYDVAHVKARGRKVTPNYGSRANTPPRFSKNLVMVLDNGLREIAPDVSSPGEFREFYKHYAAGHWLSFKLYDYQPPAGEEQNTHRTIGPNGLRRE